MNANNHNFFAALHLRSFQVEEHQPQNKNNKQKKRSLMTPLFYLDAHNFWQAAYIKTSVHDCYLVVHYCVQ